MIVLIIILCLGYFYFWGILYIVITTLVAIFKYENDYLTELDAADLSIVKTYMLLFSIMKLPSIKMFAIILLTIKVSFSFKYLLKNILKHTFKLILDQFLFSRRRVKIETYRQWNYQRRSCCYRFVVYTFKYKLTVFHYKIYIERKTAEQLFQYYTLPV